MRESAIVGRNTIGAGKRAPQPAAASGPHSISVASQEKLESYLLGLIGFKLDRFFLPLAGDGDRLVFG